VDNRSDPGISARAIAEETEDWYVAAWNLDRLICLAPEDMILQEHRTQATGELPAAGLLVPGK
jgi:hypothetical protein